ncbi:MAG: hypothetical protein ABWZ82_01685, partial [Candidatus Limnocylindrales bacterium]
PGHGHVDPDTWAPLPEDRRRATWTPARSDIFARYAGIKRRSSRAIAFIEGECVVPEGRGAGRPYKLLPFQRRLLRRSLDAGILQAVWSLPRGAGKTSLTAPLLVFFAFDRPGVTVVAAATGMRGARLAYDKAVSIIRRNPRLLGQCRIHGDATAPRVELPMRGTQLLPLPATEAAIVGQGPSEALVDEVGYVDADTLEAIATGMGKTEGSLLLAIGTPGVGTVRDGEDNPMWRLRKLTGERDIPGLVYLEHAAPPGMDPASPRTWRRANPGLGIFVDPRRVALDYATLPLSRFRQMRLGQWVQQEDAWMLADRWDALVVEPGPVPAGSSVTLGFDGSVSRDTTALVAYDIGAGRIVVLGLWARPSPAPRDWSVPRAEVLGVIDRAFAELDVQLMLADPWHWRTELQGLALTYGDKVLEWNTAAATRMAPATDAFYQAVVKRELTWDGTPELRAHVLSAVARTTPLGSVITKDARRPQHIDALIAAILAYEAARTLAPAPSYAIY